MPTIYRIKVLIVNLTIVINICGALQPPFVVYKGMRATRIAQRWNLRTRAKAGRFLLNWQEKLSEGARNLYVGGYNDALLALAKEGNDRPAMSPPPPAETAHSDGLTQAVDRSVSGGSLTPVTGEHL